MKLKRMIPELELTDMSPQIKSCIYLTFKKEENFLFYIHTLKKF